MKTAMGAPACFQCDLEIPHVCYAGMPDARWGMTDVAVAALEGARRYLRTGSALPSGEGVGQPSRRKPRTVSKKLRSANTKRRTV